jgi:hypothetical protein
MFTFLQPLFLFLLPLTGLPIVINLLRRKVRLQIRWPSLILLKRVEERRARRRLRFVEILLIILRMLIIAFAILALSRPYVHSPGGAPPRDVVIVVDNSASMVYADGTHERYSGAISAAKDYVASLNETDRAAVIFARRVTSAGLESPAEALKALDAPPGPEPLESYVPAVTEAAALLEESDRIREINVFCDMQKSHFKGLQTFSPAGYRIYVHDVRGSPGPYANLALSEVSVRPTRAGFSVKVLVKGYGDFAPATLRVNAGGTETEYPVGDAALSSAYFAVPGGRVGLELADETGYRFDDDFAMELPPDSAVSYRVEPTCPGANYFRTAFEVLGARPPGPGETTTGPAVVVTPGGNAPVEGTTNLALVVPVKIPGAVGPPDWGLTINGVTDFDGEARAVPPLLDTAASGPIRINAYYDATYGPEWNPVISLPDGTAVALKRSFGESETYVLLLPIEGEAGSFTLEPAFVTFAGDLLGRSVELAYPEFRRFTNLDIKESNVETVKHDELKEAFPGAEPAKPGKAVGGWSFSLTFPFAAAVLLLLAGEALLAAYATRTFV